MLEFRSLFGFRHLRAEPTIHVTLFRKGKAVRAGRGLTCWFHPLAAALAAIPVDDRAQPFVITGRTLDYQDVAVQGTVTFRIVDPNCAGSRIDFSVNLRTGHHAKAPMQRLQEVLEQIVQQITSDYLVHRELRAILRDGASELRTLLQQQLATAPELAQVGLEIISVRIAQLAPESDVEKALQTPAREGIRQQADEATFQRRAMAVEKERAIAENELQSKIELVRREEGLIDLEGQNARRRAEETAAAQRIQTTAAAGDVRITAAAEAERVREVEAAAIESELVRLEAYANLPPAVVFGLAARELAGKIESIGHLNVAPESFGPMLNNLVAAVTDRAGAGQ